MLFFEKYEKSVKRPPRKGGLKTAGAFSQASVLAVIQENTVITEFVYCGNYVFFVEKPLQC
jgi:hypothetical protein